MKIVQVLPTLNAGDAVGNNCHAVDDILREAGYKTRIYAENIDPRVASKKVKHLSKLRKLSDKDILIYHLSTKLDDNIRRFGGKLLFQYHNITPEHFYSGYDESYTAACNKGLQEMKSLANAPILCWADSEFNKQDLIKAGYTCPIHVVPILVPFEDYEKPADQKILDQYDDDYVNFLFVGRVVPNKAHEDVIRTFAWYQKHINDRCRLFFVGNPDMKSYVDRLQNYITVLGVKNVIFPGHISFSAVLSYYRLADLFICMSRHEGFCVPLLEAMYFHIPIMALNTTAVPYTLGGAGVLVEDSDPMKNALLAEQILGSEKLRRKIITEQDERLKAFSHEKIKAQILKEINLLL